MFGFRSSSKRNELPPISSVYVSEIGLVRNDNQDCVMVSPRRGVFCVADGIGGRDGGAIASSIVCSELKSFDIPSTLSLARRISALQATLSRANNSIFEYAAAHSLPGMGTTAAVLFIDPDDRSRAAAVYVGDSRIYRIRSGMAMQLTRDHKAFGTNSLCRAVGTQPNVKCDVNEIDARPGDRFIVCTDGLYGVVPTARIAVLTSGGTIESAAERLANDVIRAGAPDNFSFVIVEL